MDPEKKFLFNLFRATPTVYGGYQARGLIGTVAAGLCHSYSNARSELCLQPTPQLMTTPDPSPTEWGQGLNSQPHGSQSKSFLLNHDGNSCFLNVAFFLCFSRTPFLSSLGPPPPLWLHPKHVEVPGPGIKSAPLQWPEPQQRQCRILNSTTPPWNSLFSIV